MSGVVIIGAGHAAGQAAASLRQAKYDGDITIVGDEAHIPYQRPPLSKAYLKGEQTADKVYLRADSFYADRDITMKLSTTATAIDTAAKTVALSTGETLSYDHLLISTGSRPRKLSIEGSDLPGIHYLRTMDDVDGLREGMRPDANLVIVGGGYIGLEVAAVGRELGLNVHVLEMEERILQRVTTPEMSAYYHQLHEGRGVHIHTSTAVTGFAGDGKVEAVICGDQRFAADLVIVGIGIIAKLSSPRRPASTATTASLSTSTAAHRIPLSTPRVTAQITPTRCWSVAYGWSPCLTLWIKPGSAPRICWVMRKPMPRFLGFGQISTS